MLFDRSPLSHGEAHAAHREGARVPPGPHSPLHNQILAALPRADFERVLPHLEPVAMPPGWVVHGVGQRQRSLYFPTEGIAPGSTKRRPGRPRRSRSPEMKA